MIGGGVIARLRAIAGLDTTEYAAGVRDATNMTKGFKNTLKEVGSALGIAFSVGAVVQYGKAFMQWAGNISDAAGNVGILTSEMAALNAVFAKQGLGTDDLRKMFSKIEQDVFAAATGGKELDDVYKRLGLTLKDLAGMSPDQRFLAVATAALQAENATGALADVFGQKLGPKARIAIEEIVAGYAKVDEATGKMIDKVDAIGDKWAGYANSFKQDFLAPFLVGIDKAIDAVATFNAARVSLGAKGLFNPAAIARKMVEINSGETITGINEQGRKDRASMKERFDLRMAAKETADAAAQKKQTEQGKEAAKTFADWKKENDREWDEKRRKFEAERKERRAMVREEAELRRRADERVASIRESTRGVGVNADSYARIGGFAGNERAGLAQADKALQVQIESLRVQRELTAAIERNTAERSGQNGDKL